MIEVVIDSIRVSLTSQHRIIVLKDSNSERYLPIWIGPYEAEAITNELQETPPPRPMTHDLLKSTIQELGGRVVHVLISDLRNDIYYARIVIEVDGKQVEIDSRSSDAIALGVRVKAPIFVDERVMDKGGIEPDADVQDQVIEEARIGEDEDEAVEEGELSAFADFVNSLDLDLDEDDDSSNN